MFVTGKELTVVRYISNSIENIELYSMVIFTSYSLAQRDGRGSLAAC